jgi:hypothetical protein
MSDPMFIRKGSVYISVGDVSALLRDLAEDWGPDLLTPDLISDIREMTPYSAVRIHLLAISEALSESAADLDRTAAEIVRNHAEEP